MKGVDGLLSSSGGVRRGVVTEVWGPSGVGKTAFGLVNDTEGDDRAERRGLR